MLYHLSSIMNRPDLSTLSDKMLLGVSDTVDDWIKKDGNLHYCIFADGTFGKQDYPYLTYNDLLHLQNLLTEMGREPNADLTKLMDAKRGWMDANGITDYEK